MLTPTTGIYLEKMSVSSVVLPGDELAADSSVLLGPGTRRDDSGTAHSTVAGVVRGREGKKIWVDFNSKRVCYSLTRNGVAIWMDILFLPVRGGEG